MDSTPKVEQKSKIKKPPIGRSFGQRVVCRFDPSGFFYPGIVLNHCQLMFQIDK
jgi:hypothetical protein